jgi:hypothetical protein
MKEVYLFCIFLNTIITHCNFKGIYASLEISGETTIRPTGKDEGMTYKGLRPACILRDKGKLQVRNS